MKVTQMLTNERTSKTLAGAWNKTTQSYYLPQFED